MDWRMLNYRWWWKNIKKCGYCFTFFLIGVIRRISNKIFKDKEKIHKDVFRTCYALSLFANKDRKLYEKEKVVLEKIAKRRGIKNYCKKVFKEYKNEEKPRNSFFYYFMGGEVETKAKQLETKKNILEYRKIGILRNLTGEYLELEDNYLVFKKKKTQKKIKDTKKFEKNITELVELISGKVEINVKDYYVVFDKEKFTSSKDEIKHIIKLNEYWKDKDLVNEILSIIDDNLEEQIKNVLDDESKEIEAKQLETEKNILEYRKKEIVKCLIDKHLDLKYDCLVFKKGAVSRRIKEYEYDKEKKKFEENITKLVELISSKVEINDVKDDHVVFDKEKFTSSKEKIKHIIKLNEYWKDKDLVNEILSIIDDNLEEQINNVLNDDELKNDELKLEKIKDISLRCAGLMCAKKGINEENKKRNKEYTKIFTILYDIYLVIKADGNIEEGERMFFDFMCVKLGCRYDRTKELYKIVEFIYKIGSRREVKQYIENYVNVCYTEIETLLYDKDVEIGLYENESNYLYATIKSVKHKKESKELDTYKNIVKMQNSDIEKYLEVIFSYTAKPKKKAGFIYDFMSIIHADDKIKEEEEHLFRLCAILYGIKIQHYLEIKHVYNKCDVKEDAIGIIKNILRKNLVFNENDKSRFKMLCSIALVDDDFKNREQTELYDIGLRDYYLTDEYVKKIVNEIKECQKSDNKQWNIFDDELLLNIPKDSSEKLKDLKNCLKIIKSDDEITDGEKSVFELVCLFYGVNKNFFVEGKYKGAKKIPVKYLLSQDDDVKISRGGYQSIEDFLDNNKIKGPLSRAIPYALKKKFDLDCQDRRKSDRRITKFALCLFVMMSFFLLLELNVVAHTTFKDKAVHISTLNLLEDVSDNNKNNREKEELVAKLKSFNEELRKGSKVTPFFWGKDTIELIKKIGLEIKIKGTININKIKDSICNKLKIDTIDFKEKKCCVSLMTSDDSTRRNSIDKIKKTVFTKIEGDTLLYNDGVKFIKSKAFNEDYKKWNNNKPFGDVDTVSVKSFFVSLNDSDFEITKDGFVTYKDYRFEILNLIKQNFNRIKWDKVGDVTSGGKLDLKEETIYTESVCEYFHSILVYWSECINNLFKKCGNEIVALLIIIFYIGYSFPKIKYIFWKNLMMMVTILLAFLLCIAGSLRTPLMLLTAMLSIEWLILMRERKQEEKGEHAGGSKLLVVLVLMAILADISFGMIELHQMYTLNNVLDKVFSALFLGCICFFIGKFMEMQYIHVAEDMKEMERIVNKINKADVSKKRSE